MATYLVTGGAGFIGSHIVRELVKRGQKTVVVDDLSTGSLRNLTAIQDKIIFVKGDIRSPKVLQKVMKKIDFVLHQAALRAVGRSVDDPLSTHDVNITGTLNVLLAAREARVRRVVFASSSSVYGSATNPINRETDLLKPESPYAMTKMAGEHYCQLFYQLYGLPTVMLRYFNVFGPGQPMESKYSAVIPIFVNHLLQHKAPVIDWHGRQSRDFTYVSNVVAANLQAATSSKVKFGEAYNVGSGGNVSINTLFRHLQDLLNVRLKPLRGPKRVGDVLRTHASIAKARRDFAYRPTITFERGLAQSINWYKNQ